MTKKQKTERGIVIVIILVAAVVGFNYLMGGAKPTDKSNNSTGSEESSLITASASTNVGGGFLSTEEIATSYEGKVFFLQKDKATNNIYAQKSGEEKKLVFTDKDENEKIKYLGGLTSDGKILAEMAPENQAFGGSLYLVKTDGSGQKEKIIEEFASPQAPIISPDGKLIAYVLFSNTEADYGFSLYVMNAQGQNKVEINRDPANISHLSWSAESKNLAYVKGNNPNLNVMMADCNGTEGKTLYQLPKDKILSGLSWNTKNDLLISSADLESGKNSEIISLDAVSKKTNLLRKNENQYLSNATWASQDQDKFFYLTAKERGDSSASLNICDLKDSITKISDSSLIIGWTK